jgi:hypothetical protein
VEAGLRAVPRPLPHRPAGRRPSAREGWAHQRWNEFYPQDFFKTVQAGARVNGGIRDKQQLHQYKIGEFGPGGLYYNTADNTNPAFNGTTKGIPIRIHPNMPVQDHKSVWTFDGTLPPKLLMARYGQPVLMRHYNALPIDPAGEPGLRAAHDQHPRAQRPQPGGKRRLRQRLLLPGPVLRLPLAAAAGRLRHHQHHRLRRPGRVPLCRR